jgi:hypothetical protein
MGHLLVLALALLQALTGVLPSHQHDGWQNAGRAPVVRAVHSASDAEAVARAPGSVYHALRTARVVATAPLERHVASGTSGGARVLPSMSQAHVPQGRIALLDAVQSGHAPRVVASRGSLLPYYPTAPPITG